jgi:GxxExxY protein
VVLEIDHITGVIVDAGMKVHSALGAGLLESVYERCLMHELAKRGLKARNQIWIPVVYDGIEIEGGYKVDVLVEDSVIVELKVVEHILDIHKAQLLSYLKLSGRQVGLIINFNVVHLRDGIRRMVNTSKLSSASAISAGSD